MRALHSVEIMRENGTSCFGINKSPICLFSWEGPDCHKPKSIVLSKLASNLHIFAQIKIFILGVEKVSWRSRWADGMR